MITKTFLANPTSIASCYSLLLSPPPWQLSFDQELVLEPYCYSFLLLPAAPWASARGDSTKRVVPFYDCCVTFFGVEFHMDLNCMLVIPLPENVLKMDFGTSQNASQNQLKVNPIGEPNDMINDAKG